MRPALLLLAAVSTLALAGPAAVSQAFAQPAAGAEASPARIKPREVVERIAALIDEHYVDPAKAKALAAELRAAAKAGAFDAMTDPRDLAVALTDRLKPHDAHFVVNWAPPSPEAQTPDKPRDEAAARAEAELSVRRTNYGFRRVETLPGAIGYIDMSGFADFDGKTQPDAPARRAADAAMQLVSGADAIVIDLRDNGGGSPAMVGYLASYFVPKDAPIYNTFKSRGPDESEAPTVEVAGPRRLETPLYILTSGRTGSAAEAFAYTLQAAKRATIVGETSAGAANPGGSGPAGDGFTIFISGGRPVNPITKTNWEGTGVQPDVAVPAADALHKVQVLALQQLAKSPPPGAAGVENRWALEALQAEAAKQPSAEVLSAYVGEYGSRTVAVSDGRLTLRQGRRPPVTLIALSPDTFSVAGSPWRRLRFERQAGKVTGLILLSPDASEARFARAAPAA